MAREIFPQDRILQRALSTEEQAIAIYEAEVFWRGVGPRGIFREVLEEERNHHSELVPFLGQGHRQASFWNRLAGWLVGSVLSLLPRKICYKLHVLAEEAAAGVYEEASRDLKAIEKGLSSAPNWEALYLALGSAAAQEKGHAERFRAL